MAEKWCMQPCFLPIFYKDIAKSIENLEVRPDDVWVVSFPKCGTNWTMEMVWQICHGIDFEEPQKVYQEKRFPFLESWGLSDNLKHIENMSSPRTIMSHLPAHLIPRQIWTVRPKIIYVTRNVKDAAVSFYHHYRNFQRSDCTFETFMEAYMQDKILFGPYHAHVVDFWRMRHEMNILFLTYEDMKRDHPSVIEETAKFLGKSLSKDQICSLTDYLSFSKFSENSSVNKQHIFKHIDNVLGSSKPDENYNFIRKGKIGGFKEEMTTELIQKFNKWAECEAKKWNYEPELKEIIMFSENVCK
uniref:Putative sulfotransferase n=1 Tax=Nyssomyia neivai TaxID=330878 RepID=A0A1L8E4H8_9DIPT